MAHGGSPRAVKRWLGAAALLVINAISCGGAEQGGPASANPSGGGGAGGDRTGGAGGMATTGAGGTGGAGGGSIEPGEILSPGRNSTEYILDPAVHPYNVPLYIRVFFPDGGGPLDNGKVYPVAFGYHGSGGLHKAPASPGDECTQELETKYQEMTDLLLAQGVASVWVDSFYSRDKRFCEDNSAAFQQFAPPVMDNDLQQVISRVYDTVTAEAALCSLPRFDCARMLRIGTSEGGTAALLPSHRYLEHSLIQLFDPSSPMNQLAKLTLLTYAPLPAARPHPKFIMPISPGCGFYSAIPFSVNGDTQDLFYPEQDAYLEIGGADTVPAECSVDIGQGRRQLQAEEVQKREAIAAADYRYHTTIYPGAGHPLWEEQQAAIAPKLTGLITKYFAQ